MPLKAFHIVYDFGNKFPRIDLMLFPLLFVAVGIGFYFFIDKHRRKGLSFGLLFASMGGLFSLVLIPVLIYTYVQTYVVYSNQHYSTVEGTVQNYHPMRINGHEDESFDVKNVHFNFSDYDLSDYGYNNAASHGGVIKKIYMCEYPISIMAGRMLF